MTGPQLAWLLVTLFAMFTAGVVVGQAREQRLTQRERRLAWEAQQWRR